ncbi:MAG: MucBP domain-containing protein [Lachnospiraceae bacterium]|nr:MucBP domain-containing protein [Lachnospiraceae bacterium]
MAFKYVTKLTAVAMAAMLAAQAGLSSFVPLTAQAKEAVEQQVGEVPVNADTQKTAKFTWDNVTAYFVLTDRFVNGDKSNDYSYGRGLQADGKTKVEGLDIYTNPGTFHGGDLKGITSKVKEGYFNDLGVNAIWITAPYEQVHGYTSGNVQSNNQKTYPDTNGGGFPYYSYHGYWTLDYTQIDANMGDADDFGNFVDACHEHGIRVIMDVVMNHVGYTTMQDAIDYGFDGALKDAANEGVNTTWKNYYYGNATHLMGGDPEAQNFWDSSWSGWSSKWWGPGFVRADYPGYDPAGGDDTHMSLCGLPDVVTESSAKEVNTPPLLVTKWTQEGRLSTEQKELDDFFSKTGYKKQPRYYIIKWLTDWVREYGVDGFRCDTAKHVDLDAWNDLKKEGVKALNEWRVNNPEKAGADWEDDFWMTGECWGHGMGKSPYHTSGGFDSMINFSFPKKSNPSSMEGTYSSYAAAMNSDEEFNSLSYIRSHDDNDSAKASWNVTAQEMRDAGSSLLLSPGGVQIYYGDEINRSLGWTDFFTGSDYLDQRFRTDMDWDNYDKETLAHFQKVGQFRNNHPAVGAGQHQKLDGDVYTFSRTYHLEEEDEDKVVVACPSKAGTFSISVGDVFEDGEVLTDAYSQKTYTVSGGAVEATTADATSVILLQGSGIVKPSVNAKVVSGKLPYKTETLDIKLKANRVTDAVYSVNGGTALPFEANDVITIGGAAYGEKTEITVSGKSEEDGSLITKTLTYTKCDEPIVSDGFCVKVKKSDLSTAPNIFLYTNDAAETSLDGAWPGPVMTEDDDPDYWSYKNDDIEGEAVIILSQGATSNSGGTWRSTPDKAKGLVAVNAMEYDKATNTLSEIPAGEPGRVNVEYVDQNGKSLKDGVYRVGAIGKKYVTSPAIIAGYNLIKTPDNAEGTFASESTVTYVYAANGEEIISPTPTTIDPKPSNTPVPTSPDVTDAPTPTSSHRVTNTPTPTQPVGEFEVSLFVTGDKNGIKLSADVENAAADMRYMFTCEKDGKEYLLQNFKNNAELTWIPKTTGQYVFHAYAIVNGTIKQDEMSYRVR